MLQDQKQEVANIPSSMTLWGPRLGHDRLGLFPTWTQHLKAKPLVHKTDFHANLSPVQPPDQSPCGGLQHPWTWPSPLAPGLPATPEAPMPVRGRPHPGGAGPGRRRWTVS